jgi:Cu/Ag efflux protein CusF
MRKHMIRNRTGACNRPGRYKSLPIRLGSLAAIAVAALALASCHSAPQPRTEAKAYPLEGRVVSIDKNAGAANIDAKAIPGFMAAMTMPYSVPDTKKLDELQPGDQVTADLVVHSAPGVLDAHLENIVVTQKAGAQSADANAKRYHLDGKVVSIDKGEDQAIINAKDIPGYMPAMAMPYSIPDKQELSKLKPDERITGDVVIVDGKAHLENITPAK